MNIQTEELSSSRRKSKKSLLGPLVLILIVAAVTVGIYLYKQGFKTPSDREDQAVLTKLEKLIVLPDETPSVATVLDVTKLSDQAFFKNAQNGDKLVLYSSAQKAILYRPSDNIVVEVMPLLLDSNNLGENAVGAEQK